MSRIPAALARAALYALAALCLAAALTWTDTLRTTEPVHPAPWIGDYCDGLPPLHGTDC